MKDTGQFTKVEYNYPARREYERDRRMTLQADKHGMLRFPVIPAIILF
jgi:hypothetical protein